MKNFIQQYGVICDYIIIYRQAVVFKHDISIKDNQSITKHDQV